MKKIILILVILAAGGAFAAWHLGVFDENKEEVNTLTLYGNIEIREVSLSFEVNGRIEALMVEEGDRVQKGETLASLDTRRFEILVEKAEHRVDAQEQKLDKLMEGTRKEEIEQTRAEVNALRIAYRDARRTYERMKPLAEKDMTSQEKVDRLKARAETKKAELLAAKEKLNLAMEGPRQEDIRSAMATLSLYQAELALARENLHDAVLFAPTSGVIRNRILQPGDMADPRKPVLILALSHPVWARVFVSEKDLGRIYPGMQARIYTDSYPDKAYTGQIGYISPTAEFTPKTVQTEEVRTRLVYQVRVIAQNPENQLRLGMPVTVKIPLNQAQKKTAGTKMKNNE